MTILKKNWIQWIKYLLDIFHTNAVFLKCQLETCFLKFTHEKNKIVIQQRTTLSNPVNIIYFITVLARF